MSTKGTRSPGPTTTSATVAMPSPWVATGVSRCTASGPATARTPVGVCRTHGTMSPYPNRSLRSERTHTRPRTPSTIRTSSIVPSRGGMKSITRTVPSGVSHSVCRTSVSSRYCRRVASPAPTGATRQLPLSSLPSSAAKHAAESNLGRQSQSTEPSRPISAAVSRSPTSA